jgi:predicted AlkP superfamily phosphohydrolase/phosphomutase
LKKVIVIGLDGLEPAIVERLLAAGELPNLARLVARGVLTRIATTTPAQTPVAWSSFATGLNPGGHGIFDFIRRDPKTYLPDLSLNRYESRGAILPPRAFNLRQGTPVWQVLGEAGVPSSILRCPATYPADQFRGRLLAGMGVPDLRGGLGTPTFYSTEEGLAARESEIVVPVHARPDGVIETYLIGPRGTKDRTDLRFPLTIHPDRDARGARVHSAGSPNELVLREGRWSDWLHVKFKAGMFQSVRGMARFHLNRVEPGFELYASPVNFEPEAPLFPISHPEVFAGSLAAANGSFHTTGMVEEHTGLINGRISEEAFLDHCELAWREREAMMLHELEQLHDGLFYCLFDTPDRVQHLFWRYREPDHPANRGRAPDPAFARVIEDQYRRSDAVVGKAVQFADDRTLVIVLSDHGFGSFRRGVNLNTVLHDMGLLALREGARPGDQCREFLHEVDWSLTKAYALGLGGIYLNLEGREGQGIVTPGESAEVAAAITALLEGLIDPASGQVAIRRVRPREAVYSGPLVGDAPDLLVDFAAGYRASWGTSLGGVPEGQFEDNVKKWSGDHIVDPRLVPGVLVMNRPVRHEGADLLDLAPTILEALRVPKPPEMDGTSLFS